MFLVDGNLCIEVASKSQRGRLRVDLGYPLVVVSRRMWWRRPVGRPSPLDLPLFIGARIAIPGGTEEFKKCVRP
jgi:hypothetical protein